MSYDVDVMARLAEQLYQVHVERVHGAVGISRLQVVLATVKRVYEIRSPQSFLDGLIVVAGLESATSVIDHAECRVLGNLADLGDFPSGVVVEVSGGGEVWARQRGADDSPQGFAAEAVVYEYATIEGQSTERIVLPNDAISIPNPNGYPSALAVPTFWELEDSLEFYRTRVASRNTCKVLKTAWADDGENRRLVFVNSPESIMRESLAQHLRSSLRDHQAVRVNEEQNQSETEPVDIEVTWSLTTHIALIEVKWLGKCLDETNTKLASYSWYDKRAREGVPQLANYLDDAHERNPNHEVRGYLVVFDGRRRSISSWPPKKVTSSTAWSYESQSIDYKDVIPERPDFRKPTRFYLQPRVPRPVA